MAITRVTNQVAHLGASLRCRLRVVRAGVPAVELAVPPVGVTVGADQAADVRLEDPAVSRRHCTIVPTDAGFDVVDLGSRNGTHLDGVAISRATVPVGAVLRVGTTLLQLLPEELPVEIEPSRQSSFGALHGDSEAMRRVFAVLERASASDAAILFIGESGTGKELAARAVHEHSARKGEPFVVFDCGASSETLIESDLFGHRKGAFTGAVADRAGAFASAAGGTLFLDEIGDLPLPLQPKLLRLLEAGEVTPLGAAKSERHDVRVVAATHRDLWDEVGRGTFRGDLYYRLAVVEVHLPPLRRRPSDVPELVRRFLAGHGTRTVGDLAGANLDRLLAYHWPGNVRELRNVIARAVALSPKDTPFAEMPILLRAAATAADTPRAVADRPFGEAKEEVVARFEREYLEDLLRRAGGSMTEAARRAGLERKYLYRLLERVGIERPKDAGEPR
ncbi:MAG TPA: sigma 54-interacting transcriptional regulator [Kofleriaceae bacterium]|nr:sigma 54-interacting transcriptional regulator [Kofleriaceae bacterium]